MSMVADFLRFCLVEAFSPSREGWKTRCAISAAVVLLLITAAFVGPDETIAAESPAVAAGYLGRLIVLEVASEAVDVPRVWCIDVSSPTSPRGSTWIAADNTGDDPSITASTFGCPEGGAE